MRVAVLAIMPAGISIELRQGGDAADRSALFAMANDIGKAAAAIDPETGLLRERALYNLRRQFDRPGEEVPLEFNGILSWLGRGDPAFKKTVAEQLLEIRFGHVAGWPSTNAERLTNWKMSFPPGATCVEIVGCVDPTGQQIAEPVIALGRLRQWVLTVNGIYALDREAWEYF